MARNRVRQISASGYVRDMPGYLSDGSRAYLHLAGRDDVSASHARAHLIGAGGGYDSRCGWCYLGAPHTADAHTASIGTHVAAGR